MSAKQVISDVTNAWIGCARSVKEVRERAQDGKYFTPFVNSIDLEIALVVLANGHLYAIVAGHRGWIKCKDLGHARPSRIHRQGIGKLLSQPATQGMPCGVDRSVSQESPLRLFFALQEL